MSHYHRRLRFTDAWTGKLPVTSDKLTLPYKYTYLDDEAFDTTAGSLVGFDLGTYAGGLYAPGTFLSAGPGADAFARVPGALIRLSQTVRIFPDVTSGSYPAAIAHFYPGLFVEIMTDLTAVQDPFFVTLSQSGYAENPDNPSDDPRWLLQAIPDATESDPAEILCGPTFVICCLAEANPYYHDGSSAGPTATYTSDFDRFVAKHARFEKFGGLVFHYPSSDPGLNTQCSAHLAAAVNGTGGYPGALSDYGWQLLEGSASQTLSDFWPFVRDFFGY